MRSGGYRAAREPTILVCIAALLAGLLWLTAPSWGGTVSARPGWHPLRDALLERTEVGAARIGRFIYVVGGLAAPIETMDAVERYDIERNRWRRLPPMPLAVHHPAVTSHGGFLYVYGGYTDSSFGPITGALQRYDPGSRKWKLLPSSPTPRAAAAIAAAGGRLYAVGGVDGNGATTTLEVFDVDSGRWRSASPMKTPREHIAAVATGGNLYVFGGRSSAGNLDMVESYDLKNRRWRAMPSLLKARSGIAAVVVKGRPVVLGGEELTTGGKTIRPVELFDPASSRWHRLPGMLTPRHGLGAAALGRRIYTVEGGLEPGLTFSPNIEYLDMPARALR